MNSVEMCVYSMSKIVFYGLASGSQTNGIEGNDTQISWRWKEYPASHPQPPGQDLHLAAVGGCVYGPGGCCLPRFLIIINRRAVVIGTVLPQSMLIIHTQTDKTEEKEKECRLSVVTFAQHESENNIEEFRQTRTRKQAESGGVGTQRTGKIEKESSLRKKQTVRKKKENELLKDTPNEEGIRQNTNWGQQSQHIHIQQLTGRACRS